MESLAELLLRLGQPERAKQLRARKGELEQTLDWYMVNIFPANRLEHAMELARAAEAVGRRFEAHCWCGNSPAEQPRPYSALARAELAQLDTARRFPASPARPLTPAGLLAEAERCADTTKPRTSHGNLRRKPSVCR